MILDEYQQHQRRVISHYSRRSKSLSELQSRLNERGIKMNFKTGKNQRIVFSTKRNFKIDSKIGKDRVFTDIAKRSVQKNALQKENKHSKFDQMKASRKEQKSKQQTRTIER
jgi:hypothetical protein